MWSRVVRKKAVNSGQAYTSTRGKLVDARKMRPACTCKYDCVHKVNQAQREKIFNFFWGLGAKTKQWEFIRKHTMETASKRHRGTPDTVRRKVSRSYFFVVDMKEVRVCKDMFLATLSIGDSWVKSAYSHVNLEEGEVVPDKRGKHRKQECKVKVTQKMIKAVVDHVNSFPRVPAHYCRKVSKREYLERNLSINKMARAYVPWAQARKLPKVGRRQYRGIVKKYLNIGFLNPKKDRCNLCSIVQEKSSPPLLQEKYKEQYAKHHNNWKKARKLRDDDKLKARKNPSIAVFSFDLQKPLQCPHSQMPALFYLEKLNIYNLTVFDVMKRLGYCVLWHEGIGKRGSAEIGSCILQYLTREIESGKTDLRAYSDNCAGQNKNRYLFALYLYVAMRHKVKITHTYFEAGHTQIETDSIHGRIEKSTELEEIFTFSDWIEKIKDVAEELPKYEVVVLGTSQIVSFKSLVASQDWSEDTQGRKIIWKKVKRIQFDGNEGPEVKVQYEYDGEEVILRPHRVGHPINLATFTPPAAYPDRIPLPNKKIRDLSTMCDSDYVPKPKQGFLRSVIDSCDRTEEDEVTEPEYESEEEMCTGDALLAEMPQSEEEEPEVEDGDCGQEEEELGEGEEFEEVDE